MIKETSFSSENDEKFNPKDFEGSQEGILQCAIWELRTLKK